MSNPLKNLESLGQAIWLDYIKRDFIHNDQLKKLIEEDGLRGITSNPSIFEKAIADSHDYDQDIFQFKHENKNIQDIYESITQCDVRDAADEFKHLYDNVKGMDGFVSLEVNPHLAHDTQGTVEEARRLWKSLDRPNVMIKVPATPEGIPAIQQLISEGLNINVTLLFGLDRYRAVAEAYITGLEARLEAGKPIDHIASVASFFLSRIDVLVDPMLDKIIAKNNDDSIAAKNIQGEVAIASAKCAYAIYQEIYNTKRFKKLIEKGARSQRLLWASTSTKNPAYSDLKYVEALIGQETVNTLPRETLDAYRDHGDPKLRLTDNMDHARSVFQQLSDLKIDIKTITAQLEREGVEKFNQSFDKLIDAIKDKKKE